MRSSEGSARRQNNREPIKHGTPANANEAIKIAAKEFDIPPERQNRIAVEK
jgi:hypothetical protein